ncbi:hypothetical protein OIV83_003025 [Microbotryomycetes sp. JL201]|nr:hypothetical protein OIV83_003025 [Microbotryomycetes sp. JL201]
MWPTSVLWKATSRSARNAKRLQTGLYDGRSIQSGNQIGETFNSKTRRRWLPNVQTKTLFSEALGERIKLRVTTGALRTIDKMGGLDSYLFRVKDDRLGQRGLELRQLVKEAHSRAKAQQRLLKASSTSTGKAPPLAEPTAPTA